MFDCTAIFVCSFWTNIPLKRHWTKKLVYKLIFKKIFRNIASDIFKNTLSWGPPKTLKSQLTWEKNHCLCALLTISIGQGKARTFVKIWVPVESDLDKNVTQLFAVHSPRLHFFYLRKLWKKETKHCKENISRRVLALLEQVLIDCSWAWCRAEKSRGRSGTFGLLNIANDLPFVKTCPRFPYHNWNSF